jgi:hypothetical protein
MFTRRNERNILSVRSAAMTKEKAYEVLKRSALILPHFNHDDGQDYGVKPGKFYREYGDAFGFVGYPYTPYTGKPFCAPAPEHAYVYRVDKATGRVSVGERLEAEEAAAYWLKDAVETREEAFEVLKTNEEIRPHYDPKYGKTYAVKPGKFYGECMDSFSFVGYPYKVEPLSPPDPDYAYEYFVDKEDGRVSNADVPLGAEEAAAYWLEDAAETREEAYEAFQRSALIRPHDDPATGQTYAVKTGKFYRDYGDAFAFVGYPYTVGSVSHPAPEHAYVYRVDKATAYVSVGERLGAEEAPAYWLKDAVETREHAYEVLKASEMIRPRDNLIIRETYAIRPGKFYRDYGDAFGFVGYPYTVEPSDPPAPDHAFVYLVYKASGHVIATGERLAKTEAPAYWLEDAEA